MQFGPLDTPIHAQQLERKVEFIAQLIAYMVHN